ncbi:MAG TPA: OsmC family peroxiredoxin [Nitrospirae bacterium]|nr:OsmC family peroxiredoxin [Nitrospirota bacterium]
MSEEREVAELEEQLKGYKEKVATVTKGWLEWDRDLIFVGRTQRGYEIDFDAKVEWGCMPTESLLLSLAGCMAIDMVSFLQKMRCNLRSFKIEIEGERNPTPPQYYRAVKMLIRMSGEGFTEKKIQRAISLSQDKYCSVYNSLRPDMKVTVDYVIEE